MALGQHLSLVLSTGGCIDYLPGAPGTLGSFASLVVVWMLSERVWPIQTPITVGLLLVGATTSASAERCIGSKGPKAIMMDEIVRMVVAWLALLYPAGCVVAGFGLLHILDISNPIGVLRRLLCGGLCSMTLQRRCLQISFGKVSLRS
jgi:phosphatidylglycerophosphatase A